MIPMQYALRRRMMVSGGSRTFTVTLVGTFYHKTGGFCNVIIDGAEYNSEQTIKVPAGTKITINAMSSAYGPTHPSNITHNGVIVAEATKVSDQLSYSHIVDSDCTIESEMTKNGSLFYFVYVTLTT